MSFTKLLAPVDPSYFVDEHWRKQRPLYIPGAPDKFSGLFSRDAFIRAMRDTPPGETLHVKAVMTDELGHHNEHGCIGAEEALSLYEEGRTICATAVDAADENLARFVRELKREFLFPGDFVVNCYWSPEEKGFNTHFDQQSVWLIQIEGEKHWRFSSEPAIPYPNKNVMLSETGPVEWLQIEQAQLERPDESTFQEVTLRPGDVLYLPPGTWHRARAVGHSLALTLTQAPYGFYILLFQHLKPLLFHRMEWRRDLPGILAKDGDTTQLQTTIEERFEDLKQTINRINPRELFGHWYRMSVRALSGGQPLSNQESAVQASDLLRVSQRTQAVMFEERGEEDSELLVYHDGREYPMPTAAKPLLQSMLRESAPFEAAAATAWLPDYEWADLQPLLSELVQIGLLERAS